MLVGMLSSNYFNEIKATLNTTLPEQLMFQVLLRLKEANENGNFLSTVFL